MTFVKHDAGKLRFDLLDPEFEAGMAVVVTLGAAKYDDENWKRCTEPFRRYYAALRRHLNAFAQGERVDEESGVSHLYHAAVCLMFLAHFERVGDLETDVADDDPELSVEDVAEMGRAAWNVPLTGGVE
jgi:hypothetical protein